MAELKPGAEEAPACSLPKEPAMVTSCRQGQAINPERAGGGEPRGGREGGQLSGIESCLRRRPTPPRACNLLRG